MSNLNNNPVNRVLVTITLSTIILIINIVAVSNGSAEKIYTQLENSIIE